jgi:two-component system, NarL family, nitrate/nitrite response regulator NarL
MAHWTTGTPPRTMAKRARKGTPQAREEDSSLPTLTRDRDGDEAELHPILPAAQPAPANPFPINVYVVHGQPLIAESLGLEIGGLEDMAVVVVEVTDDGVEARIVERQAHIALLDADLGAERLSQIIEATKGATRSLILANDHDVALMHACIAAGAVGILIKPRGFLEVEAAIRRVHDGRIVLTQQQLAAVMSHSASRQADAAARALCERLSEREREILVVLATGASTDMVATSLHISRHTVQSHIKNALRKLNVRSKLAAVVLMMAAGLIEMD